MTATAPPTVQQHGGAPFYAKDANDTVSYLIIEEESGTSSGSAHPQNGYYAGDFSAVPLATPRQLAALTAPHRPGTWTRPA